MQLTVTTSWRFLFRVSRIIKLAFVSLKGEWEDNKKSLLEFIWTAHWGVKGVVSFTFIASLVSFLIE